MVESDSLDQISGRHMLSVVAGQAGIRPGDPDWADFERRFDRHFPDLSRLFHSLYGSRPDFQDQRHKSFLESIARRGRFAHVVVNVG